MEESLEIEPVSLFSSLKANDPDVAKLDSSLKTGDRGLTELGTSSLQ